MPTSRHRVDPPVLAAVSAGGVLGALARLGVSTLFPHGSADFPWATFGINVTGCLLIGALMVIATERSAHRLLAPFLGVGVLGGFTTFSAYVLDADQAMRAGAPGVAVAALAGTLLAGLAAVWIGAWIGAWIGRAVWDRRRSR